VGREVIRNVLGVGKREGHRKGSGMGNGKESVNGSERGCGK
jgi:hypothetical protein